MEVVVTINGKKHWLWRAVDLHGAMLDLLALCTHAFEPWESVTTAPMSEHLVN